MHEKNSNSVFLPAEMLYKSFGRNGLKVVVMSKFSQVIYVKALFMSKVNNTPITGNKSEFCKQ